MSSSESEWIDEVTEPAPAESHAAEHHTADPVDVESNDQNLWMVLGEAA